MPKDDRGQASIHLQTVFQIEQDAGLHHPGGKETHRLGTRGSQVAAVEEGGFEGGYERVAGIGLQVFPFEQGWVADVNGDDGDDRQDGGHSGPAEHTGQQWRQGRPEHQGDGLEDVHLGSHVGPLAIVGEHFGQQPVIAGGDGGVESFPDHDGGTEIEQQSDRVGAAIEGRREQQCKGDRIGQPDEEDIRDAPPPAGAGAVGEIPEHRVVEGIVDGVEEPEGGKPGGRQVHHIHDIESNDAVDGFRRGGHSQAGQLSTACGS